MVIERTPCVEGLLMSCVVRLARRYLLLFAVASAVTVIALLPSREQIGVAVERLAAWWSPPAKRPIRRVQLGKAKRALFQRRHVDCRKSHEVATGPGVGLNTSLPLQ
jgi:hypothetical protein